MNEIAAWLTPQLPVDEDLDRARMTELAAALGEERRLWERLVEHRQDERHFVELYRDVHLDVWLICWLDHQDTGYHDHDLSSGAVYVCDGILAEDRLQVDGDGLRETRIERPSGSVFDFDAARIHRMHHVGGGPATSLHLYSPALWRMGHYAFDAEGALCRTSVTYADEMWTAAGAAPRASQPA